MFNLKNMKNIFRLALSMLILLTISSCDHKTGSAVLDGNWELRHIEGIQVAGVNPDFKAGNGNIYKFDGQNFEKYTEGIKIDSGTFVLSAEKDVPVNNTTANYCIVFNKGTQQYLKRAGNKLVIFNGVIAADGTEFTFEKQ